MPKMEPQQVFIASAAAVIVFEIIKTYERQAPALSTCRAADSVTEKSDVSRQLYDADLVSGTIAVVVGSVFAIQSRDWSIFLLAIIALAVLSLWRHHILNAEPTTMPR